MPDTPKDDAPKEPPSASEPRPVADQCVMCKDPSVRTPHPHGYL